LTRGRGSPPRFAGVDEHLFVNSQGVFCRVTDIVPVARMQELHLTQGPLARLRKQVMLEVGTPPGPAEARAPGREEYEGRALLDALVGYAKQARVPEAGTERWQTRATLSRENASGERPDGPGAHGDGGSETEGPEGPMTGTERRVG